MEEADPAVCGALESSLWEVKVGSRVAPSGLQAHSLGSGCYATLALLYCCTVAPLGHG